MQVQKVGGANKGRGGERGGAVKEVRRATGRDRRVQGGCGKDMGGEGPAQGSSRKPRGLALKGWRRSWRRRSNNAQKQWWQYNASQRLCTATFQKTERSCYLVVGSSFYVWLAVRAVVVCSVNLCVIKPGPIICGLPLVVSLTIKIGAAPNN